MFKYVVAGFLIFPDFFFFFFLIICTLYLDLSLVFVDSVLMNFESVLSRFSSVEALFWKRALASIVAISDSVGSLHFLLWWGYTRFFQLLFLTGLAVCQ